MKRIVLILTIAVFAFSNFIDKAFSQKQSSNNSKQNSSVNSVTLTLPRKDSSVRFAVVGDTGTGTDKQQQVADIMVRYKEAFPYEFVLLLGDNLYGGEKSTDYLKKFENIYRGLLDNKVKFYATLGNHDEPHQRFYDHFNMNGKEYYNFKKGNVSFYSLNSNYMDKRQVKWLEDTLSTDTSEWKISFFHHPPYSSGRKHGSDTQLREIIEPIFLKYGVDVVFTGHEHFYERIKPQKGIYYFISGAGGKLRKGDVKDKSALTAMAYDQDMSFMLIEIVDNQMHYQVISRTGKTVDSGVIVSARKRSASVSR